MDRGIEGKFHCYGLVLIELIHPCQKVQMMQSQCKVNNAQQYCGRLSLGYNSKQNLQEINQV
jgi:hypothetical protein